MAACSRDFVHWLDRSGPRGTLPVSSGSLAAFSPSGKLLAVTCDRRRPGEGLKRFESSLELWQISPQSRLGHVALTSRAATLRWINEETLLLGHLGGMVQEYALEKGRLAQPSLVLFQKHGPVVTLLPSRNDSLFVVARQGLVIYDLSKHESLTDYPWESSRSVGAAALTPGLLWVCGSRGKLSVYTTRLLEYAAASRRRD